MATKTAEQLLHQFRSSSEADVAMSLLRSKNAIPDMALMAAHLGDGQVVDGESLVASIDADLPRVAHGYVQTDDDPLTLVSAPDADTLLSKWTKRGWIYRSVAPDTRAERYQLTSGAGQAILQMRNLRRQTSIATESALGMVMGQMRQIATEANPDPVARRDAINERIDSLVKQRDALDRGETPQVNQSALIDSVATLAQLVERIPGDVARYGEQLHAMAASLLRESLTDDPAEFADSLQQMFDGHDVLADSPEGQAFQAFAGMIGRRDLSSQLESDVADITTHVDDLPAHLADTLEGFLDAVSRRVREVEDTRRTAFRRMRNFVLGGDVQHYRSMRSRVSEAQRSAAEAFKHTHGGRDVGFVVPVSGVDTQSVGRLRLDQGTASLPDALADSGEEFDIDPAGLSSASAIDWAALRTAVSDALDRHRGFATLHQVLSQLAEPRTGDVLGLWSLATHHGEVDDRMRTTVLSHTEHGPREIDLPYLVFHEPVPEPSMPTPHRMSLDAQPTLLEVADD